MQKASVKEVLRKMCPLTKTWRQDQAVSLSQRTNQDLEITKVKGREGARNRFESHQSCFCWSDFVFFPKALRRVLPENPLNTDTSTLTLTH